MKIYTQDDKPKRDKIYPLLSIAVFIKTDDNMIQLAWYDYLYSVWRMNENNGQGNEVIDCDFQWVYPEDVFKKEKV